MKSIFQNQFDLELLRSERKRTLILITLFSFAVAYRIIDHYLFANDPQPSLSSFSSTWLFPIAILLFEIGSFLYINKRLRSKKKIPLAAQYINVAVEICLPSLIILLVARQHPDFDVMLSPAVFIYFIFIILSTLRLNFGLSFFCGALASAWCVVFSIFLTEHFNSVDAARCLVVLLGGIAAGHVARQIRAGINSSLYEAEKQQRVTNLFGQQVSKEVAEKMLENDGKIESRRMNVAIMFLDIRNFTAYVADKSPEEIVQYQNSFFSIIITVIEKYNGIVNQILGDGCMVTFGAPLALENPSRFAVDAALEILDQLENNVRLGKIAPTRIGIGIHTGEVVTGNIGTIHRQQYSITGNVVILATRIEQLNKKFQSQLLISEDVYLSMKYTMNMAESLGDVALKGWHKPMNIYKLA